MVKLTEKFVLSKANASNLNNIRKINLWFVLCLCFLTFAAGCLGRCFIVNSKTRSAISF